STEALVKNVELGRVSSVLKPGEESEQRYQSQPRKFEPTQTMPPEVASTISEIESRLRTVFSTQVRVRTKNSSAGSIEIDFYSIEELERLLDLFAIIERSSM
ncbi:MAG TPA: hypothetical protein VEC36_13385, partial [Patescibacteria group bacterium]|nr:hypothetical protein [Patescibacteria group bacterium]